MGKSGRRWTGRPWRGYALLVAGRKEGDGFEWAQTRYGCVGRDFIPSPLLLMARRGLRTMMEVGSEFCSEHFVIRDGSVT